MLVITDIGLINGFIVRIKVSNNLTSCFCLLLFFLSNKELLYFFNRRNGYKACALGKLFDILFLNKLVDFLLYERSLTFSLNLNASIGRIANRIHPSADCFNGIGILANTCCIRTYNLLFTNDFFLIINSSVNIGALIINRSVSIDTLRATNCITVGCRFGNSFNRIDALANTANEATFNRSRSNLNIFVLTWNGLRRALFLNNTLGERTIFYRSTNDGHTLNGNATGTGKNDTLLCKK